MIIMRLGTIWVDPFGICAMGVDPEERDGTATGRWIVQIVMKNNTKLTAAMLPTMNDALREMDSMGQRVNTWAEENPQDVVYEEIEEEDDDDESWRDN